MNREEAKKIMEEARIRKEEEEKSSQTFASIALLLTAIFSFYQCYGWMQPDSLVTFIIYIIGSIFCTLGFMIPVSFLGHILKLF